jgi:predicted metalloprotease with PDZ domain
MWGVFLLGVILVFSSQALAQTAAAPFVPIPRRAIESPVHYLISLAKRGEHVFHVEVQFPSLPGTHGDVQLPVWNALYQVRDFSQYVRNVNAQSFEGKSLPVRAVDKTTWNVEPGNTPFGENNPFTFKYDIFADSPGPFSAQLNEEHAFINPAQICVYLVGAKDRWIYIKIADAPGDWRAASMMDHSELPEGDASYPFRTFDFMADNYDAMADSPVEVGDHNEQVFRDQRQGDYHVVVHANPSDYDMKAITEMARKLAWAEVEWMQDRPFDHYLFIYHFPRRPAGGGMEHAYSTAIDAPAERVQRDPLSLADITAHEFFHLWNVKRIRPQSMDPVDYTKEQYTRALWFSEGVTNTVADYIRVRAGYLDGGGYLAELGGNIRNLESRPARLTQSVEESSLDAWLEKYSYYEQPERSISYYNKGEIVGVLLDLQMREASGGKKSLRDLFQWMNQRYAKQGKFFPDSAGVEQAAETVAGADFHDFFARYVTGADPIPYDKFFATVGLRLEKRAVMIADAGFRMARSLSQLGVITSVEPGSAAAKAGLKPGDILQEFNGRPVTRGLEAAIESMRPGDAVRLKLSGAGGQREISFKLGSMPSEDYVFAELDGATAAQRARRTAWIRGESQ